ncbi:transglycosylase family protein [Crossiella sp. SN42]|nr:resuscitation-promoting factor [Crossiella sp. SN42]MCO1577151.1 transglycosylase family protein [Crossiella sp. SN42]
MGTGTFEDSTPSDSWFEQNPAHNVAVLDRPAFRGVNLDHPSHPSMSLSVTTDDVLQVLGPDAYALLDSVDVDIDELIGLLNAETTMLPALRDLRPEDDEDRAARDRGEIPPVLVEAVTDWKRRFLKAGVAAALVTLTGGGAAAVAMDKQVTVDIDGTQQTVRTYASTVAQVLADQGLTTQAHDALSPSPQASIADGGKIVLERGRQLKMTVDGQTTESWVRARTVGDALNQLGINHDGAWLSKDRTAAIPTDGLALEIKTPKNVTLFDGGNEPQRMKTTALTVSELLQQLQLSLGPDDQVNLGADGKISDGAEIHVSRTGVTVVNKKEAIEPTVEKTDDPTMMRGEQKVEDPGTPGEQMVTYRVTMKNGKETAREKLGTKVVKEAKPKKIRVGTKVPPDGAVWDRLAQCEATGNWAANTGNGYYGGLQFNAGTWRAYGGAQYAALPHQASREQQIAVATKLRDARGGYGAWPHCSSKLNLPK